MAHNVVLRWAHDVPLEHRHPAWADGRWYDAGELPAAGPALVGRDAYAEPDYPSRFETRGDQTAEVWVIRIAEAVIQP